MKKFLLTFTLILLFVTTFAYASETFNLNRNVNLNQENNEINIDIHDNILNKNFVSWYCGFDTVPSIVEIGSNCYCLDTSTGIPTSSLKALGYGDIFQCLKESGKKANIRTAAPHKTGDSLSFSLSINYIDETTSFPKPELISHDSEITLSSTLVCNNTQPHENLRITFYRLFPFTIIQQGNSKTLNLRNYLNLNFQTDQEIRCRVDYYKDRVRIDSKESEGVRIQGSEVFVRKVHISPAHPRVQDQIYCNGFPGIRGDMDENTFNHTAEFYLDGSLIATISETNSNLVSRLNTSIDSNSRGKEIYCRYTVQLINSSGSVVASDSATSLDLTVRNTRPVNILLDIFYREIPLFLRGNHIYNFVSDSEQTIVVFTDFGDVSIKGWDSHVDCGDEVISFEGVKIFDMNGNLCNGAFESEDCTGDDNLLDIKNDEGVVVSSIKSDGKVCFTGYLFKYRQHNVD